MMSYTDEKLQDIFSYHSPTGNQPEQYIKIRNAALEFAKVVIAQTPPCADQTTAIRKIREAVMTANAAIALNGVS